MNDGPHAATLPVLVLLLLLLPPPLLSAMLNESVSATATLRLKFSTRMTSAPPLRSNILLRSALFESRSDLYFGSSGCARTFSTIFVSTCFMSWTSFGEFNGSRRAVRCKRLAKDAALYSADASPSAMLRAAWEATAAIERALGCSENAPADVQADLRTPREALDEANRALAMMMEI